MKKNFSKRPSRGERFRKKENDSRRGERHPGPRKKNEYKSGEGKPFRKREAGERRDDRGFTRKEKSFDASARPPFRKKYESRGSESKFKGPRKKNFPGKRKFQQQIEQDDSGLVRLNKYISNTGLCSRREADQMIEAGVISVNGVAVTQLGYKVKPGDEVKYNGQPLKRERMVYVLLNKPKDYITTTDDPQQRKTVMELVHSACRERIYPVGRLDRSTTGLLLLTNDGDLTRKLTHPSSNIKKIYHVFLDKSLKPSDLDSIREGVELDDGMAYVDRISYVDGGTDKKELGVELHSGRNRIVRRIFEKLGYKVTKLDRVYFAGITKKDLPRGRWRFLSEMELNMLKMMTGGERKKMGNKEIIE
jgi:23S rRNA pseudouridine2605 synthase